jgi:hypothetical protein
MNGALTSCTSGSKRSSAKTMVNIDSAFWKAANLKNHDLR